MVCFQVDQELGWSLVPNAIAAVGLVMSLIVLIFGIRFRIDGNLEGSLYGKFVLLFIAGCVLCATAMFVHCENASIREHQERMQSR